MSAHFFHQIFLNVGTKSFVVMVSIWFCFMIAFLSANGIVLKKLPGVCLKRITLAELQTNQMRSLKN